MADDTDYISVAVNEAVEDFNRALVGLLRTCGREIAYKMVVSTASRITMDMADYDRDAADRLIMATYREQLDRFLATLEDHVDQAMAEGTPIPAAALAYVAKHKSEKEKN